MAAETAVRWLGETLDDVQWGQLEELVTWLREEAVEAGGLGPNEADRIWPRHVADSLTFAGAWMDGSPPRRLLDVGTGIGLPGIPLAILWRQTEVVLLDRSGKRADLARRICRRLGLANIEVRQGDVRDEPAEWEGAVFRAVLPPPRALDAAAAILAPAGRAAIGMRGHGFSNDWSPPGATLRLLPIPRTILDESASLLIMDASG